MLLDEKRDNLNINFILNDMKNIKRVILPLAATTLVFGNIACTKVANTKNLVGQWEATDMDGDLEDLFEDDNSSHNYKLNIEFHLEGDAEFCIIEGNEYKYCNIGEWEWSDDKKKELELDFGEMEIMLTIDTFDGDEFTGEMTMEFDDYSYEGDIEFERVYEDKSVMEDKELEKGIFENRDIR